MQILKDVELKYVEGFALLSAFLDEFPNWKLLFTYLGLWLGKLLFSAMGHSKSSDFDFGYGTYAFLA
jgi:hypothetical protein